MSPYFSCNYITVPLLPVICQWRKKSPAPTLSVTGDFRSGIFQSLLIQFFVFCYDCVKQSFICQSCDLCRSGTYALGSYLLLKFYTLLVVRIIIMQCCTCSDYQMIYRKSVSCCCHHRLDQTVCRAQLTKRLTTYSCYIILQIWILESADDLFDVSCMFLRFLS